MPTSLAPDRFDAVIFDLDGVITDTAAVHAAAWKATFDEILARRAAREGRPFVPFDADLDYRRFVDGRPRLDGVRTFLAARGITLPEGDPTDPPERETVWGVGNRKNAAFRERLADGVEVFETSVTLVRALRRRGLEVAVVSASKNCGAVLAAAGLLDLFEVQIDGIEAARLNLPGKPAPDVFLEAARRLGVSPARAVVVEDAITGVEAGRRGGFGLVVGVARGGEDAALAEHGAGVVVRDLGELELAGAAPDLPSALASLDAIRARLAHRRLALFLDYDGTLTPIVARPEDAVLAQDVRAVLRAVARRHPVAIVSGRDRRTVEELVGVAEVGYVGSHGFDIVGPPGTGIRREVAVDFLPTLDAAEGALREKLRDVAGSLVERKKFTVAIHFRLVAAADRPTVEAAVDAVRAAHPSLRKEGGKAVFELRPDLDWDKGRAVLWLLEALGLDDALAIHVGDDLTDENVFTALAGRGIGIAVGVDSRPTAATYALRDPAEVKRFLDAFAGDG